MQRSRILVAFSLVSILLTMVACGTSTPLPESFEVVTEREREIRRELLGDVPCLGEYERTFVGNPLSQRMALVYIANFKSRSFSCRNIIGVSAEDAYSRANAMCRDSTVDCYLVSIGGKLQPWTEDESWFLLEKEEASPKGFSTWEAWYRSEPYKLCSGQAILDTKLI